MRAGAYPAELESWKSRSESPSRTLEHSFVRARPEATAGSIGHLPCCSLFCWSLVGSAMTEGYEGRANLTDLGCTKSHRPWPTLQSFGS